MFRSTLCSVGNSMSDFQRYQTELRDIGQEQERKQRKQTCPGVSISTVPVNLKLRDLRLGIVKEEKMGG